MNRCAYLLHCTCYSHHVFIQTRIAVVVSAMGGLPKVTDMLLDCVRLSASNNAARVDELLSTLLRKHVDTIHSLITDGRAAELTLMIESNIKDIRDVLRAVSRKCCYLELCVGWSPMLR
jgi:aspartokinase/homoserine dehydrogenase 1